MLEKLLSLIERGVAALEAIASTNTGTLPSAPAATSQPAAPAATANKPAAAKKVGRPATGSPPAAAATNAPAGAVTFQELKDLFMPWLKQDPAQTAARTAKLNGVLNQHRDDPNIGLIDMNPSVYPAIKADIEALISGAATSSGDDCPV